jgi:hypothetical protein
VFENRVLKRLLGPKRNEIMGGRKTLHNEELHNSFSSPNTIRMIMSWWPKWERGGIHTYFLWETRKKKAIRKA